MPRISQLPAASVPLNGTELVPIVQNGVTVQATALDVASQVPVSVSRTVVTATAGQTSIPLTFNYTPATNGIQVFKNGQALTSGPDYTETSANYVTLATGASAGDVIMVLGGQTNPNGTLPTENISHTNTSTGGTAYNLRTKLDTELVSVMDFGADNTGVADSYTAIINAYNSSAAIIHFPAGTYKVSQTINLDRGVTLSGSGAEDGTQNNGQSSGVASTIINYTGTGNCIQIVGNYTEGVSNIHIRDLMINGTASADGGLYVGSGTMVSKCTFKNLGIFGFSNSSTNKGYGVGIGNCLESVFENVYVAQCHDGWNIGFGSTTSCVFTQCISRINSQYGWLIREGNGFSFYQCIAEGNTSTGLVLNPTTGQNLSQVSFYSWYSEANCSGATTYPGALIRTTGTGSLTQINFYSPIFYDTSTYNSGAGTWTIACIKFGYVNSVRMLNAGVISVNSGFIECQSNTSDCEYQGYGGNISPTNITGNIYTGSTGQWCVQTTPVVTPEFRTGTWTPTITAGGTQSGSGTGIWQKSGRVVTFQGTLVVTAISGTMTITGLPYSADYSAGGYPVFNASNLTGNLAKDALVSTNTLSLSYTSTYGPGAGVSIAFSGSYFAV